MLRSLLYVSDCRLRKGFEERDVEAILLYSRKRNVSLEVTGALMYTGAHFVQILEGRPAAVDGLMASIVADPRHANVDVVRIEALRERRFAKWLMAYWGPEALVESQMRTITADRRDDGSSVDPDEMIAFLQGMSDLH